ncbi:MAG: adenosylmethionine--8-amino-7-oxononanoate transaminase [Sedimentisphaerales bacterium]|nr:adenosylmethionine--8-amino-7-oxononanoate transaminase [Sedimentisphaerales bacterium]
MTDTPFQYSADTLTQWDHHYLWHPFTPMRLWLEEKPLIIQRGEGVYLYDTEGRRYIDGISSLWCNIHGHNHPRINKAICTQVEKIAHSTLLGLSSQPSVELAKKLVDIAPAGLTRVFYSDAGATAVEIALKMAFQYWRNIGQSQRQQFIALRQSYHGDTIGSVSVGGIDIFHRIFGPLTFAAHFCDLPHPYRFEGSAQECRDHSLEQMRSLLQTYHKSIAAIIVEPLVQGAAGIIVHPQGFLDGVRKLADEFGVLLIIDEVATGFGRTGKMFACEHEDVAPDLMCLAKGITGGYLPLAATLASEKVFDAFLREPSAETTFYHGHTYTGNALACAAALGSLAVFEEEKTPAGLDVKIKLLNKRLNRMKPLRIVGDVRQCGMMAGIELVDNKDQKTSFDYTARIGAHLCQAMRQRGLILRPLGDVIVIMPPLVISTETLTELLDVIEDTLNAFIRAGATPDAARQLRLC